jgi:hypothetical protein
MADSNEISALLTLIDDPDTEVFDVVSVKIVEYGKTIIPTSKTYGKIRLMKISREELSSSFTASLY